MPNWTDPVEVQKDFQVAIALVWLSVGLAAYDHVRYAAFDWSIITGARKRRWPQIFYFAVKLIWYGYIVVNIIVTYTNKEIDCQATIRVVELFMGLLCIGCSVLLAARAVCVWHGTARTVVAVVLGILWAGLTATWMMSVPYDVTAVWVPKGGNPWTDGACAFTNVAMTYSIKYAVTSLFDAVVLCVTVAGVLRMRSSSRIGSLLISQGILYFLVTFAANTLVFGLTVANLNPVMSLIGAVPSSCVAMLAATQLYAELAEQGRPLNSSDAYKGRRSSTFPEKGGSFFGSRNRPPTLKYSHGTDLEDGRGPLSAAGSDETRNGPVMAKTRSNSSGDGSTLDDNRTDGGNSYLAKSYSAKIARVLGEDIGGVSVHREVTVEAAPLPEHFHGAHFLNDDQLASLEGASDPQSHAVQAAFSGLSKQLPKSEEPVAPSSASVISGHRKSESSVSRKPAPRV